MNFGEADRILTVITEKFGKIKAIARGVRKGKSKLAGHLEPFMLLDMQLYEGKTFYTVTGSVIKSEFPLIHTELKKTSQAFYLAELVDKFMPDHQRSDEIFNLLLKALEYLDVDEKNLLLRIFELKIIEASGFHPELYGCVHCKEKLAPGKNFWDAVEGGVVCASCQEKTHHGKPISNDLIKLFRLIEQSDFSVIERLNIKKPIKEEAENILSNYIKSILEREIKSMSFMRMVN